IELVTPRVDPPVSPACCLLPLRFARQRDCPTARELVAEDERRPIRSLQLGSQPLTICERLSKIDHCRVVRDIAEIARVTELVPAVLNERVKLPDRDEV